jgi:hypothetical protein
MNAVEIEEAVSELAARPFDAGEFPFAFLMAFGNKPTTIKRLRTGSSNKSDIGGVLQTSNIHILTCAPGEVTEGLTALRDSAATVKGKAKFILATDGETIEAEELASGDTVACTYADLPDHFGAFLPLAGISTVRQIRESSFDIRATSKLNKLYVELLKDNPDWGRDERRHDMNHFMARLIFCFFAEDTDIFPGENLFSGTVGTMSDRDAGNTHAVIGEIFRAMNTPRAQREAAGLPRWTSKFPYVNGGLFAGSTDVPVFSKIARSFLIHIGSLKWTRINPDIFGSMIQAVADDEERGALGMHYTSVPNILKVLNPLFLDNLRSALEEAGDNRRTLLNLRKRMARIRVFDPACGSGNFLVIAYKEMRAIEAEINRRRGEADRRSDIPLTNFRGIELRDFPAEIARLALIIAEFQCDVLHRGQQEALAEFLPLDAKNWIVCGNALRLDWLSICPPTGTGVKLRGDDLFNTPLEQAEIEFENEGGETYICGNPPYAGATLKAPKGASLEVRKKIQFESEQRKADLKRVFAPYSSGYKSLDYVSAWFLKAAEMAQGTRVKAAFVATNSICQGQQVATLWPLIFKFGCEIEFAHTNFKWSNLARNKAGVTCVIIGIGWDRPLSKQLYSLADGDDSVVRTVANINAYLIAGPNIIVGAKRNPPPGRHEVTAGGKPVEDGNLLLSAQERRELLKQSEYAARFLRRVFGANEYNKGIVRFSLWFTDEDLDLVNSDRVLSRRVQLVRAARLASSKAATRASAESPHKFQEIKQTGSETVTLVPTLTAEKREYIPAGLEPSGSIITNLAFGQFDGPLFDVAVINSRIHFVWVAAICGKFKTDYRYSNTLGWNTFPVPKLTEKNKADLTACAEAILLAREAHFPATIAELYDPERMPENLRAAHDRNDETLERIYLGRRFRNDTERLEKLFEMYTKMTGGSDASGAAKSKEGAS